MEYWKGATMKPAQVVKTQMLIFVTFLKERVVLPTLIMAVIFKFARRRQRTHVCDGWGAITKVTIQPVSPVLGILEMKCGRMGHVESVELVVYKQQIRGSAKRVLLNKTAYSSQPNSTVPSGLKEILRLTWSRLAAPVQTRSV